VVNKPRKLGLQKAQICSANIGRLGWQSTENKEGGGDTTLQRLNVCAALALVWAPVALSAMGRKSGTDFNGLRYATHGTCFRPKCTYFLLYIQSVLSAHVLEMPRA
jgi:hypothetical protein